MQTTNLDRMRSKAAQAREVGAEEKENQIYTQFTDNMEANIIQRAKQAKDIASLVNATETPVILCGDFNDTPGTFTYETLKGNLQDGFLSTYRGLHNLLRIDYLFHSPSLLALKYGTMSYDMSDHNPVYLEVGL